MLHSVSRMTRLVLATVVSLVATAAFAMPPSANTISKPLVVVRFNQPMVHYEKPMTNAVQRAMSLKPDVQFNVVSYVPYTPDPLLNQRYLSLANAHLREVSDNFMKMGVAVNKIVLSTEMQAQLQYDEVHIFVR